MSSITAHVLAVAMATPDDTESGPAAVHAEVAQFLTGLADTVRDRAAFLATIETAGSGQSAALNADIAARIRQLADAENAHAAISTRGGAR